jgi:hypothetical protein
MTQTSLDLSLFRWIASQTTDADRQALLSTREAICSVVGNYCYLEVGSFLGGSLQPHVIDARCIGIFSIDPRPSAPPDERRTFEFKYEDNSTDHMIALLSKIPSANVSKIQTFESSTWELTAASIPTPVELAFIDGEHTNSAVFRDFISVRRFLSPVAILAFHDCFTTAGGLHKILRTLKRSHDAASFLYFPPSQVVAIAFGSEQLNKEMLNSGWKEGLPFSRWEATKILLRLRYPGFVSAVRGCKRLLPGNRPS